MVQFIKKIVPPDPWKIPVILISGVFSGLFIFLIYISKAPSYLSDNPKTCVNCHIMAPQYATWNHSSHREVAACNDCHVPHNNLVNHYFFKAKDGMRHASVFTMRREPQVIFIKEAGQKVVRQNCIRCHKELISDEKVLSFNSQHHQSISDKQCWECHRETPHGRVNSLSSVPYARVPLPESPVPFWLKNLIKTKE